MVLSKLKRLDKEQRKKAGIVALFALIIIGTLVGGMLLVTVYPAADYGNIALFNEATGASIDETSTLNVQDGDFIVAWLMDDPNTARQPDDENFKTYLYLEDGTWIEDGAETYGTYPHIYVSSLRWWFDLDQCPQGTFTYYIRYYAYIEPGVIVDEDSDTFQITNAAAPVYDDAEFTEAPDDVGFGVDESPAYVSWKFDYDGPCVVDVTLDGTEVDSQTYEASSVDQIYTHLVDTSVAGTFVVEFTVTPDDYTNPVISDSVTVTIAGDTDTTTTDTTTTDTTTTDTDTTTTDTTTTDTTTTDTDTEETPPTDEPVFDMVLIGMVAGIAAGVILIGILLVKGGRPKTKQKNKGGN